MIKPASAGEVVVQGTARSELERQAEALTHELHRTRAILAHAILRRDTLKNAITQGVNSPTMHARLDQADEKVASLRRRLRRMKAMQSEVTIKLTARRARPPSMRIPLKYTE